MRYNMAMIFFNLWGYYCISVRQYIFVELLYVLTPPTSIATKHKSRQHLGVVR